MSGPIRSSLFKKLEDALKPLHLELNNESPMHGLPESAEKHFRLVLVSSQFAALTRVERHRKIKEIVAEELSRHVHALSIQAFTPEEWEKRQRETFASPACLGGSKRESGKN